MTRKSLNVIVDEELHSKFKAKCKADGLTIRSVITDLMQGYVDGNYVAVPSSIIDNSN